MRVQLSVDCEALESNSRGDEALANTVGKRTLNRRNMNLVEGHPAPCRTVSVVSLVGNLLRFLWSVEGATPAVTEAFGWVVDR